ncbi:MAG: YkgJ family cysteine cluster protein [Blastocatellia bacterium]|nr:YkgJ family cysteine cluster protein [Blastocatellia bacterium]
MMADRTEFGVARTVCDCRACIANCRFMAGSLIPADLHRISEYLNEPELTRFAFDNLLASPGAIIFTRGRLIRIRTLVPARRVDGACRFLTAGDRCSIHAVSPFSCSHFGCSQSREEADALSLRGLMEVAKAWQQGELYARLWLMLYHAGRIAPSPVEARARMRAVLAAGEYDGDGHSTSERR